MEPVAANSPWSGAACEVRGEARNVLASDAVGGEAVTEAAAEDAAPGPEQPATPTTSNPPSVSRAARQSPPPIADPSTQPPLIT
jgi:hypothetical protein